MKWSDSEVQFLKENYMNMSYPKLAQRMNRPLGALKGKIRGLGLRKWKPHPPISMTHLSESDLGYIAGVIDSDGHIGVYHRTNDDGFICQIQVTNTDKLLVDWFSENVGTRRYAIGKAPNTGRPVYHWKVHSFGDIKRFLEPIIDRLVIKKEQASVMLDYANGKITGDEAAKRLKHRKRIEI